MIYKWSDFEVHAATNQLFQDISYLEHLVHQYGIANAFTSIGDKQTIKIRDATQAINTFYLVETIKKPDGDVTKWVFSRSESRVGLLVTIFNT